MKEQYGARRMRKTKDRRELVRTRRVSCIHPFVVPFVYPLFFLSILFWGLAGQPVRAEQVQMPVTVEVADTVWLEVMSPGNGGPIPNLTGFIYFDERLTEPLRQLQDPIVSIDQIFDLIIPVEYLSDGRVQADFTGLGAVLTSIARSGDRLAIWTDFTPQALSPVPYLDNSLRRNQPPISYKAWEDLVYQTARYVLVEKKMQVAYWPVWNEPDLGMFWDVDHRRYTHGAMTARNPELWNPSRIRQAASGQLNEVARLIEYMKLYEVTARAIKRVDPDARVGGPNPSSFNKRWLTTFLNHSKEQNLPVDFITWHYPAYPEEHKKNVQWLRTWAVQRGIELPPIVITEWHANRGSAGDPWIEAVDVIEIAMGMMDTQVEAAFYYTVYNIADVESGLLTPVGQAFKSLGKLQGTHLSCNTSPEIMGVAAKDTAGHMAIVFRHWNQTPTNLQVKLPEGFTSYTLSLYSENNPPFHSNGSLNANSANRRPNSRPQSLNIPLPGRCFGVLSLPAPFRKIK